MSLHAKLRKKALPHQYSLPKRREEGDFSLPLPYTIRLGRAVQTVGKHAVLPLDVCPSGLTSGL